ncbi:MAG: cryptochrome/photolyase family protein [Nitrospirota bacterium]
MSRFLRALDERNPPRSDRRWIFVPEDQLSDDIGPISRSDPREIGIILIESHWKAARRPYHKQKLALLWSNLRHFAIEQASRGVAVRYLTTTQPFQATLAPLIAKLGPLTVMEPAERELRADLDPLVRTGEVIVLPHEGWLTTREQFIRGAGEGSPWRMDAFYRFVRKDTGILMDGDVPVGGRFSYDVLNRRRWAGDPPAPKPLSFPIDEITAEVGELIDRYFSRHPGEMDLSTIPATDKDAQRLWRWAKRECLPHFGPYEDAMSAGSRGLFHTRLSSVINLHRLLPRQTVTETAALNISLASKEGFIRQILGWREFVRHVHRETDGFRQLPAGCPPVAPTPGDAGYASWRATPWPPSKAKDELDGGARPSYLTAHAPLPSAYWGAKSGLACLDRVVADVWAEGYSHHITRLMVLSNLATLLDVSPRELTDWFWVAYTDAFDWVVEPNVLAMGTYAVGDLMTTKPYVSGAAYIAKMSDYCKTCQFNPNTNCPITSMYWAFIARHASVLNNNVRMRLPLRALERRAPNQRMHDAQVFAAVQGMLQVGKPIDYDGVRIPLG